MAEIDAVKGFCGRRLDKGMPDGAADESLSNEGEDAFAWRMQGGRHSF